MDAIANPKGHPSDNKDDHRGGNDPHLSRRQVDAERRGGDQEKNRLLQSILDDTAVDLCRDIFFAQSGVNGLGEKTIISERYDPGKQGKDTANAFAWRVKARRPLISVRLGLLGQNR